MPYQRVELPDTLIGEPGPLPAELVGLADETLADLSAHLDPEACAALGYVGQGFLYVDPPPAPPVVPAVVSRMQAKMALLAAGLLDDVEAAVSAGSAELQIYWNEASDFHRDHPVLIGMTEALGLTAEQTDALFIAAGQIA
jgi:hypothetical protein